jgi:hypothetical protein
MKTSCVSVSQATELPADVRVHLRLTPLLPPLELKIAGAAAFNRKTEQDTPTPAELLNLIDAKAKEAATAIAKPATSPRSAHYFRQPLVHAGLGASGDDPDSSCRADACLNPWADPPPQIPLNFP